MCGRYGQTKEQVTRYMAIKGYEHQEIDFESNNYLGPGNDTVVLANTLDGIKAINAVFNYHPPYKSKLSWINARAEGTMGKEKLNPTDDPGYDGPYRIAKQSGSAGSVRNSRCVIPVDYFLEGSKSKGLSKPYLIRRKDKEPFPLAGFFSYINGTYFVGIVTTPAAKLLSEVVEHHRSPFVLTEAEESHWINKDLISPDQINELFHPFDSTEFEAIQLAEDLKKGEINSSLYNLLKEFDD